MHMPPADPVRAMWVAYREGEVEAALPLFDEGVEFVTTAGQVFRGRDGIRSFFSGFDARGERFSAQPYSFERHPGGWIVVGNRRIRTADGATDDERLYFVHMLRRGLIVHLSAYTARAAAVAALASS